MTIKQYKTGKKATVTVFMRFAAVLYTILIWTGRVSAQPSGPHDSFLSGPWEIVVKMGFEGEGIRFPLEISDEKKPQKLNAVLPVMGTPISIKLNEYMPDLKEEIVPIKHPGGGIAAKLRIKGKNLDQEIWLCSEDPERQSISSSVGGVAIRRVRDRNKIGTLVKGLTHRNAVGILSVWPKDNNQPLEFIAETGKTISIPKYKYKVDIVKYLPHYSIDKETKEIINLSDDPVNPAIMVRVNNGQRTYEHWIWVKFPSSPHQEAKLPLRMQFTDVDLSNTGKYFLVAADGSEPWLLTSKKGRKTAEKSVLDRSYYFENTDYSFSIIEIKNGVVLKTQWTNNSERLWRPAVIATIEQNGVGRQAALELNKPLHYKTDSGTLVLLYRRRPASRGIDKTS